MSIMIDGGPQQCYGGLAPLVLEAKGWAIPTILNKNYEIK